MWVRESCADVASAAAADDDDVDVCVVSSYETMAQT